MSHQDDGESVDKDPMDPRLEKLLKFIRQFKDPTIRHLIARRLLNG